MIMYSNKKQQEHIAGRNLKVGVLYTNLEHTDFYIVVTSMNLGDLHKKIFVNLTRNVAFYYDNLDLTTKFYEVTEDVIIKSDNSNELN